VRVFTSPEGKRCSDTRPEVIAPLKKLKPSRPIVGKEKKKKRQTTGGHSYRICHPTIGENVKKSKEKCYFRSNLGFILSREKRRRGRKRLTEKPRVLKVSLPRHANFLRGETTQGKISTTQLNQDSVVPEKTRMSFHAHRKVKEGRNGRVLGGGWAGVCVGGGDWGAVPLIRTDTLGRGQIGDRKLLFVRGEHPTWSRERRRSKRWVGKGANVGL